MPRQLFAQKNPDVREQAALGGHVGSVVRYHLQPPARASLHIRIVASRVAAVPMIGARVLLLIRIRVAIRIRVPIRVVSRPENYWRTYKEATVRVAVKTAA